MADEEVQRGRPTSYDEMHPGRFLKAGQFKGKKVTLTVSDVETEELEGNKGKQIEGIISFKETPRQWVPNKTNRTCLKELFGPNPQDMIGKQVTLFPAPYEGDVAVRVWGSPELDADRDVVIELPRKRPFKMTMHKTERR